MARDKEVFTFGSGAADAAVISTCIGDSVNVGAADDDENFGFRVVGATPESAKAIHSIWEEEGWCGEEAIGGGGRRKVGVAKRPLAVDRTGGVGGKTRCYWAPEINLTENSSWPEALSDRQLVGSSVDLGLGAGLGAVGQGLA